MLGQTNMWERGILNPMGRRLTPRHTIQVGVETHRTLLGSSGLTRHTIGELVTLLTELYLPDLTAELLKEAIPRDQWQEASKIAALSHLLRRRPR